MQYLFDYYGQTVSDVAHTCAIAFGIKIDEWVDSIDRTIVFLSKYANLPPAWVEEQDIVRQNRLVRIVCNFIEASSDAGKSDTEPEWQ
jgi:hypothetical protein